MLSAQSVSDFAKSMEAFIGLPRCEDFDNYRVITIPEWVVDHFLMTGSFPEDWGVLLKHNVSAKSFTVARSLDRPGLDVTFWKESNYDWSY